MRKIGEIAQRITGLSEADLMEYNVPRVTDPSKLHMPGRSRARQSVRIAAGMFVTTGEIDAEHRLLRKDPRKFIAQRRKEARARLGLGK